MSTTPIPVTVLTGFLGAGKTTLLRYLLEGDHGLKIAVIENEFSEADIDGALLGDKAVRIVKVANGCVCCTGSKDLSYALTVLLEQLDQGEIEFDRLVIECTGLADPGPVAQTFFMDEDLREHYLLDGIITLVDAVHAQEQLSRSIAQAQVGFADRLLVSKRDLVEEADFLALCERLQRINRRAPVHVADHGRIDLSVLLDIRGFNLNDQLDRKMLFRPLMAGRTEKPDNITSLALKAERPLDIDRISRFMEGVLERHGSNLLRYKGILNIVDEPRKLLFQGVQRLYGADWDREWEDNEVRESVIVFIGMDLPEAELREGFESAQV
ncbi:GTP-binding protein [Pseudomonas asuensis]|uniref:GTP-binding protein n=1 Tax=Pseudomonas asuensis TaxID=1825787 RepID=A0ABQ2GHJ8_9PSED|nr:GTPase [Pseudomonas asuensis]GGL96843.1 GTP-binding protein [Pseudomonas asuensis]